jgi:hypothetical protein
MTSEYKAKRLELVEMDSDIPITNQIDTVFPNQEAQILSISDNSDLEANKMWEYLKSLKTNEEKSSYIESLSAKQIELLRTKTNPYKVPVALESDKFLIFSFINFKQEFLKRLLIVAYTNFLSQSASEYRSTNSSKYESELDMKISECQKKNIIMYLSEKYKDNKPQLLALYKKINLDTEEIITEITNIFKESRPDLSPEAMASDIELEGLLSQELEKLSNEEIDQIMETTKQELNIKKTREEIIMDEHDVISKYLNTFFLGDEDESIIRNKFTNYFDVNYNKFKDYVTNELKFSNDYDMMLAPLKVVDSLEEFKDFVKDYNDEFELDVHCAKIGVMTILESVKENRDKIEYFNKNTTILEQMIKKCQNDKKIGTNIIYNKIKKSREANPLDKDLQKALSTYQESFGNLDNAGVKDFEELTKNLKPDTKEPSLKEVEMQFNMIKPNILEGNKPILSGTLSRYNYNL